MRSTLVRPHGRLLFAGATLVAVASLAACGSDDGGSTASTNPPPTSANVVPPPSTQAPAPPTTAAPKPPPTTADGGGGMSAGAPSFTSFEVSSPVQCQSGNATATMSFTTENVVQIEIKIGSGGFESTAGYGPNESSVVASIPCSGAGTSSIQLRGCTEDNECATSESRTVEITA